MYFSKNNVSSPLLTLFKVHIWLLTSSMLLRRALKVTLHGTDFIYTEKQCLYLLSLCPGSHSPNLCFSGLVMFKTSYEINHKVLILWCLDCFTQNKALGSFVLLTQMSSLKTKCCPVSRLHHVIITPSYLPGHLNCFHDLAIVNDTAIMMW